MRFTERLLSFIQHNTRNKRQARVLRKQHPRSGLIFNVYAIVVLFINNF